MDHKRVGTRTMPGSKSVHVLGGEKNILFCFSSGIPVSRCTGQEIRVDIILKKTAAKPRALLQEFCDGLLYAG